MVREEIEVEDDCWLASGSTILAGIRVGRESVVAAGAVVTKDVPPYAILADIPARVIGWRARAVEITGEGESLPTRATEEATGCGSS